MIFNKNMAIIIGTCLTETMCTLDMVRGGMALTGEGVELGGVWELAEESKDWAFKHNFT